MALKKTTMLTPRELPRKKVFVPELADPSTPAEEAYVYVRTLEGWERDAWEKSLSEGKGRKAKTNLDNIRCKLVVATCVDDDGVAIFTADDLHELSKRSCLPITRIFTVASELNGLSQEDVDELVGESSSSL